MRRLCGFLLVGVLLLPLSVPATERRACTLSHFTLVLDNRSMNQDRVHSTRTLRSAAILALVFVAITLPPILMGRGGMSEQADERDFHLPAIRRFAADWPRPDLVHYELAMTPGYHLGMALLWKASGSLLVLRLVNGMIGLALILTLWWAVSRLADGRDEPSPSIPSPDPCFSFSRITVDLSRCLLILPLVFSPYVLGGAISLTTDNAALLGAAAIVGAAALRPMTLARAIALGVAAAGVVFMRQVHLWLGGVVLFGGFLASPAAGWAPASMRRLWADDEREPRSCAGWGPLAGGIIALALPAVMVAVFFTLWGGLVPVSEWSRRFHSKGANPAAPAFCLALLGALGPCFVMMHLERLRSLASRRGPLMLAAAAGLLAAIIVRTSAQLPTADGPPPDGRGNGWLWRLAHLVAERAIPNLAERSVVIAMLAPIGAVAMVLLWRAAADAGRRRAATIIVIAMLGWLAAQTMNFQAWQRYFEPLLLVFLALLTACGMPCETRETKNKDENTGRGMRGGFVRAWLPLSGVAFLAAMELALSAITLFREILRGP